jgi:pyruvate dehydrogenase E1 component alpha subunit
MRVINLKNDETIPYLYHLMLRSRRFEEITAQLWEEGRISGELHLGVGEEAIIAGVISQLIPGDAIATDHRGTAPAIMWNVDPVKIILELVGHSDGLCSGQGGHMHLFSKEHLFASSGIVGSSGPAAVGFSLATLHNKTNNITVAFFGEGAMNQGMLLESLNLASVWNLPVLFVCKDNDWAITTKSHEVTGGSLLDRAKGFGIKGIEVDGLDAEEIRESTKKIISKMRSKKKEPFFIQAKCVHREGHFLGDPLLRFHKAPIKEFGETTGPLMKAVLGRKGERLDKKLGGLTSILTLIAKSKGQLRGKYDPLNKFVKKHSELKEHLEEIEKSVEAEMHDILNKISELFKQEVTQ